MKRSLALPMLAAAMLSTAAQGSEADSHDQVEKHLRGCIAAGASSAPKVSLASAVQHVRAFCGPQIRDLADIRAGMASDGLAGAAAEDARARAVRQLNDEIAHAVANFTGLTQ